MPPIHECLRAPYHRMDMMAMYLPRGKTCRKTRRKTCRRTCHEATRREAVRENCQARRGICGSLSDRFLGVIFFLVFLGKTQSVLRGISLGNSAKRKTTLGFSSEDLSKDFSSITLDMSIVDKNFD